MQCVIIAAGKGTRMRPLTENIPKPLVKVNGKSILDHIVDALPAEITELVLVVGYRGDMIREHCGEEFYDRTVVYVEQSDYAGGTGNALMQAKDVITGKFLFMYADDLHGAAALQEVVQNDHAMLGMRSDTPELFGVLVQNEDGTLKEIIEKPEHPSSNLVNIGGFVIEPDIFNFEPKLSVLGEVLVTDLLTDYAKKYPVKIIEQEHWIPIGYPEDVQKAEQILNAQQ